MMSFYLEISARQTGKTTRLLDAVKIQMLTGESAVIVVPNLKIKKWIEPRTAALCITISELFTEKIKERIYELYRPNFFFDEFDFMANMYPILDNGYYVTTPAFIREYSLDICDKLLQMTNMSSVVSYTQGVSFYSSDIERYGKYMHRQRDISSELPYNSACKKCGSDEISKRFFRQGEDTGGLIPNRTSKSTEFVNREDSFMPTANKDCIVHRCLCCGYEWDGAPLR